MAAWASPLRSAAPHALTASLFPQVGQFPMGENTLSLAIRKKRGSVKPLPHIHELQPKNPKPPEPQTSITTMKAILPAAIASLALTAFVQASDYREHNLTISLRISTQENEKFKETNNGYKASQRIVSERISNKEILEVLVDEGVIPEIRGWSLKVLTNGAGVIDGFYLTKKNHAAINVSAYFEYDIYFSIEAFKERFSENNSGKEKFDYDFNILGSGYLDIVIGDFYTDTCSLVTLIGRETSRKDGSNVDSESVTRSASFENIVGEAYFDDEPYGIVVGFVKAVEGKKTDLGD
jgi:hypothetical protein